MRENISPNTVQYVKHVKYFYRPQRCEKVISKILAEIKYIGNIMFEKQKRCKNYNISSYHVKVIAYGLNDWCLFH